MNCAPRPCEGCGTPFTPSKRDGRFCSLECYLTWKRRGAPAVAKPHKYKPYIPLRMRRLQPRDVQPYWTQAERAEMDENFCRAMGAAIDAGLERATVGVKTAPCTRRPVVVHAGATL
jgi:hypothetical protein